MRSDDEAGIKEGEFDARFEAVVTRGGGGSTADGNTTSSESFPAVTTARLRGALDDSEPDACDSFVACEASTLSSSLPCLPRVAVGGAINLITISSLVPEVENICSRQTRCRSCKDRASSCA